MNGVIGFCFNVDRVLNFKVFYKNLLDEMRENKHERECPLSNLQGSNTNYIDYFWKYRVNMNSSIQFQWFKR